MTVLYFDCFSGASGDMILGALIDAGADPMAIQAAIAQLPIESIGFGHGRGVRNGLDSMRVKFTIPDGVPHRSHSDIVTMIQNSSLPPQVVSRSLRTFQILATAEAKVHGTDIDSVHFHEVGALDAIADVVGAAVALEHFDPSTIVCSPIPMGSGSVETAHGRLPVPAPAVTAILEGVPIRAGGEGEVITPTGAAILKAACDRFGDPPAMQLRATGYGAGSRELSTPNVLRVMVGDEIESERAAHMMLETNIDDMSPELVPYVIEVLIREGAQDAWSTPILMKKGRPAFKLTALVDAASRERVLEALYRETTTFGVRTTSVDKDELLREWVEIEVEGHAVRVKIARRGSEVVTVSPEYDDAVAAARATGLPLKDVYDRAARGARQSLKL